VGGFAFCVCHVNIATNAPGGAGILGHVPACYTYLEAEFLRNVARHGAGQRVSLHEYARAGWTFHAKGLWATLPHDATPALTFVGSPNFGYRSAHRDLEAQVALVTTDPGLRARLGAERDALFAAAPRAVTLEDLAAAPRRVAAWERAVIPRIRSFL
jgi:CDP-diacylglycerol--glycerol-3-phosphate 3-phosphatidyltransferase